MRYIGIDAPEIRPDLEAFGIEAWQANRKLVEGKTVHLEQDVSKTDKLKILFGRWFPTLVYGKGVTISSALFSVQIGPQSIR